MLLINVLDNAHSVTFQLDGTLADFWVGEVERCSQRTLARRRWPVVRFDLTGVTFIDAAGKAYLSAMHRQGAKFIAADCLTKAVVPEITNTPILYGLRAKREVEIETKPNWGAP
jgi:anti-anti-sigma regulatory factor